MVHAHLPSLRRSFSRPLPIPEYLRAESMSRRPDFDRQHNDENKIADDRWVPCIWEDLFFRVRLTMRYCEICKRAFCEGELIKRTVRSAA